MQTLPSTAPRYSQRVVASADADAGVAAAPELRRASRGADLRWLVRLRWLAVTALAVSVGIAHAAGMVATGPEIAVVIAGLGLGNAVCQRWLQGGMRAWSEVALDRLVFAQLLLDMVALATLVHLAGGIENPFEKFMVFHVALGAILLPQRLAWGLLLIGGLVHSGFVAGPPLGLLPLHPLLLDGVGAPSHGMAIEGRHVGLYLAAHWLAVAGVVYFVRTVRVRQQAAEAAEREHQRVTSQNERLARIGGLTAGVAHSIRNPLHGALNCLDILDGEPQLPEADVREMRGLMREALVRIERVTRRLLALTRAVGPTRQWTSTSDLLAQVERLASAHARTRAVTVAFSPRELPSAEVDADQLSEALLNVIDNAIDETPPGGVVQLSAAWVRTPDPHLRIEVTDAGRGIDPDAMGRLFEPFFTTKPIGRGTGMGLAIARRVVHDHGGAIEVLSGQGVGTCVRISLPTPRTDAV